MQNRFARQPGLIDCALEDRVLMDSSEKGNPLARQAPAVAPMVLTTSGFVILPSVSVAFSSFAGVSGEVGSNPNYGLNIAANFYMTGFGLSVMTIGNSTGDPTLGPLAQAGPGFDVNANVNVSPTLNPGGNQAGAPSGPSVGQSIPLTPGSGFRYIGQTANPGALVGPATDPSQEGLPNAKSPFEPLAPLTPAVPEAPTESEQPDTGAISTPKGPSFEAPARRFSSPLDNPVTAIPGVNLRPLDQPENLRSQLGSTSHSHANRNKPIINRVLVVPVVPVVPAVQAAETDVEQPEASAILLPQGPNFEAPAQGLPVLSGGPPITPPAVAPDLSEALPSLRNPLQP